MLRLFANSIRHRGPVGGLFVCVLVLMLVVMLGGVLLAGVNLDLYLELFFVTSIFLVLAGGLAILRHRRAAADSDSEPIHRWPKLGQNDCWMIRSKLQQPVKRK